MVPEIIGIICLVFVILTFTPVYKKFMKFYMNFIPDLDEEKMERWTYGNRAFFAIVGMFLLTFRYILSFFH